MGVSEKKKLGSFTPESEIEEDGSGEAFSSGEKQEGDGISDLLTSLEDLDRNSPDANRGPDAFNSLETDGIPLRTGISQR